MRISDGSSDGCSSDLFVACAIASVGEVFAKIALGGVAQRLAVVLMQVTGHPFVDALVHQQHFDAALVQRFALWTVAGGTPAGWKSGVEGKRVGVRVNRGRRRLRKKKNKTNIIR